VVGQITTQGQSSTKHSASATACPQRRRATPGVTASGADLCGLFLMLFIWRG
jgi:hypothetical protein